MKSNWTTHTFLMGMQNSTTILEKRLAASYKTEYAAIM